MIIQDLEAFKHWLAKTLEPICDADPTALASYVVALVKKDKTDRELKDLIIDQLDVYLQKETLGFVDKLFEALNTKLILPQPDSTSTNVHQEREMRAEVRKGDEKEMKACRRLNQSLQPSSTRHKETRTREDLNIDDHFRKREYENNVLRRDSYRNRYNRRQGRSRSYCRSRSRSWSKERHCDRDRDRSRSRTRSRDKDSRKQKFDLERQDQVDSTYAFGSSVPPVGSAHFPVPALSSTRTVIAPSHHGNSSAENWPELYEDQVDHSSYGRPQMQKKRCRGYDEKGFCIRGDMCPFDHGSDPVVVEDVNLSGILPFPAQPPVVVGPPPPGLPLPPPPSLLTLPTVNLQPPVTPPGPLPPSLPPVTANEIQVRLRAIRKQQSESQLLGQNSSFPIKRKKLIYVNKSFLKKIMELQKTSDITKEKNGELLENSYQHPGTEELQLNEGIIYNSDISEQYPVVAGTLLRKNEQDNWGPIQEVEGLYESHKFNMLNKRQAHQDTFIQPQNPKEVDEETDFCKTLIPYMRRVPLGRRLEMHIAVLNCISSFCQSPAASGQNPMLPFTVATLLPTPSPANSPQPFISDIPPYSQSTQTCRLRPQLSHETHHYIQFCRNSQNP